jgi:hypothetical protein
VLFKADALAAIRDGDVDLAFRRWRRARVRAGTRLRTRVGLVEVVEVAVVGRDEIGDDEARRAGFGSREELLELLDGRGEGEIHRVELRFAGADPRVALRRRASLGAAELDEVTGRLERLDRASPHGPWTREVLELIGARPEVRAADLAASLGREKQPFKRDVRKLKELGLTESLERGYRLSPRGRAVLEGGRGASGRAGRLR